MDRIEAMNPYGIYIELDSEEIEELMLENTDLKKEKQKLQKALYVLINICENNTKLKLENYKKLIEDMEDEE